MFHLMAVHGADTEKFPMRPTGCNSSAAGIPRQSAGHERSLRRSRAARAQCWIRSSRSGTGSHLIRKVGNDRYGLRHRRNPRRSLKPYGEIPGSAPRGSRLRSGLDTQPGGPPADQCHGSGRATLWTFGRCGDLCQFLDARRSGIIIKNRRGQSGLWGYSISGDVPIVLLQIADLANISWYGNWCRRMRIGVLRDWWWTW